MSRSYKHTPISKGISRISKQQANKKVRQRLKDVDYDIVNNAHYKSILESCEIFDYKFYCPNDNKLYIN